MSVVLHDYSGHAFPAQLARSLAGRGHTVDHVHCSSYVSGKGQLELRGDDPAGLSFTALEMDGYFDKYNIRRRIQQELDYARTFNKYIDTRKPDVVLMCNVPLIAHSAIERHLKRRGVPTVFWHQDVYSHAMGAEARRRSALVGPVIAHVANRLERGVARRSRSVIAISSTFRGVHERWGTPSNKLHIIPNWAPLDEITPRIRENEWSRSHRLANSSVMVYAGTLGLKHNPDLLADLLRDVRLSLPQAQLIVVSEGDAAEHLQALHEPGLTVLPFQSFTDLPNVLASGDLLVTILEPTASEYSVPSKTLSYLCAGRPVVALLPESNPAFSIVQDSGGLPIDPSVTLPAEAATMIAALLQDKEDLLARGLKARAYATEHFNIDSVTKQFEDVLGSVRRAH